MKVTKIIFYSLLVAMTAACRGEDIASNADPLYGMETPSTIVAPYKRIAQEVDSDNGTIVRTKNYVYENKKLVQVLTSDNSSNEVISYAGEIINKIYKTEVEAGKTTSTTTYFVYNSAKALEQMQHTKSVFDGTFTKNYVGSTNFTYENQKVKKATTTYSEVLSSGGTTPAYTETIEWTYSGNNVVRKEIKKVDAPSNVTTITVETYSNFDSKKSIYGGLPVPYVIYSFSSLGLSQNNPATIVVGGVNTEYTYTYDSDSPLTRTAGNYKTQYQYIVL